MRYEEETRINCFQIEKATNRVDEPFVCTIRKPDAISALAASHRSDYLRSPILPGQAMAMPPKHIGDFLVLLYKYICYGALDFSSRALRA